MKYLRPKKWNFRHVDGITNDITSNTLLFIVMFQKQIWDKSKFETNYLHPKKWNYRYVWGYSWPSLLYFIVYCNVSKSIWNKNKFEIKYLHTEKWNYGYYEEVTDDLISHTSLLIVMFQKQMVNLHLRWSSYVLRREILDMSRLLMTLSLILYCLL